MHNERKQKLWKSLFDYLEVFEKANYEESEPEQQKNHIWETIVELNDMMNKE